MAPTYEESLRGTLELLRKHIEPVRDILPSHRIQEDLGLDSLSVMEFANDLESRFRIDIPSDRYDHISTVEDVARLVVTLSR
jgi:acyl carrier protein